jgi:hypothetical protein
MVAAHHQNLCGAISTMLSLILFCALPHLSMYFVIGPNWLLISVILLHLTLTMLDSGWYLLSYNTPYASKKYWTNKSNPVGKRVASLTDNGKFSPII